jgi:succinate dehydrogenase/fumarate reductase flavoprotein subunit
MADVIVIGAGATGITAAIAARELGASVIVLEAERHIGGHAICSGGNLSFGGGNIYQKKYGVEDSPERLFRDLTDWTVVEPNGAPPYRYNDHELARAFANNSVAAVDFLLAHGVKIIDQPPDNLSGHEIGMSAPRTLHAAIMDWPEIQTGNLAEPAERQTTSSGNGLMQPLYAAARELGVIFLLRHRMTAILREQSTSGRVVGVSVVYDGKNRNIDARKAVIIGTGGSSGNVDFRRMFDPRLTEEYCGLAGMPWSNQDASGELAAMAIGASLWGLTNFSGEYGTGITKPGSIGCQYGYANLRWFPGSEVFAKARAIGLKVGDWQNVILVNMLGKRFYDETGRQFTPNLFGSFTPYTTGNWRNARAVKYNPSNFINAALAGVGDGRNGDGPIWAIFDADAVAREGWEPLPPHVDCDGVFFSLRTALRRSPRVS